MARLALLIPLLLLVLAPVASAAPKRLPAKWAKTYKLSAKAVAKDKDRDGLTNWGEYRAGTNPRKRDTDRDGVLDPLEDRDRDKLSNADEIAARTDPRKRDSDRDKVPDGREDRDRDGLPNADERVTGHDLQLRDTNADGFTDGRDNAGWITSSVGGAVTIRLAAGGTLVARLTADSWVDCTAEPVTPVVDPTAPSEETTDESPVDPVDEDPAGLPDSDDDPAGLPEELGSLQQWDEPETEAVDLGDCAKVLHTGAVVHRAVVEAGVLTDLELIRS